MKVYSIKKTLAILLAVLMLVSVLPLTVFAEVRTDGKVLRTDICKIGNQGYETFQDAVNAVPADGQEVVITLLNSVYATGTTIVPKEKNITIELNGKTYAFDNEAPGVSLFTNYGTLTFQDQTDTKRNGTGRGQVMSYPLMPDMSPCPDYSQNTVTNYGTLNVKSGYLMSQGDGYAAYVVDCLATSGYDVALNVTGGKLESVSSSVAVRMYTHKDHTCDVSITGGVVTSLWVQDGTGGAEGKGSLTIKKPGMVECNVNVTGYAGGVLKHFKLDIDDTEIGTGLTYNFDPNEPDNTISVNNLKAASFTMKTPAKVLSNGYFMNPVDAACIADGYVCLLNPDKNVTNANGKVYTYKICKDDEVPEDIEYAARVIHTNGSYTDYFTMGYAMSAVKNGETVQLLADAYGRALVNYPLNITFDLNGYTLNGYFKNNGGTLTIEDTSEDKTGKVIGDTQCVYVCGYNFDIGEYCYTNTTINGGTYEITSPGEDESCLILFDGYAGYATTTINGGTFNAKNSEPLIDYENDNYLGSIKINGGEINAELDISGMSANYTRVDGIILEINGGHFTKDVFALAYYGKGWNDIIITDGTFDGYVGLYEYSLDRAVITGGNFGQTVNIYYPVGGYWSTTSTVKSIYGGNFKYAKYDTGADLAWVYEAADGLAKASNTDEETMAEYPWTLKPLQIDKKRVEVDEDGKITSMDVKNQDGSETAAEDAQTIANALAQSNTTVDNFADTNLDKAFTGKKKTDGYDLSVALDAIAKQIASDPYLAAHYEVVIDEHNAIKIQEKKDVSPETQTYKDEDIDIKVKVDPKSASVEVNSELVGEDTVKTAIINTETFEVKPIAKTSITVKTVEQVENPETHQMEAKEVETQYKVEANLKNEDIKEAITFPLPIDKNSPAGVTAVYHSDDKDDLFKDYLGLYEIMTDPETGDKFILIEAESFSFYTIQNMNSITTTNVVAIKDDNGNYRGFDTLAEGIADYNKDAGKYFLEADFSGTAYENAAAAQETVRVYVNAEGDGKYYLTEDFSGIGYEDVATARAAVPVSQKPVDKSLIILKDMLTVSDDFLSKTITLDLNGLTFKGEVTNAKYVTVINSDDLHQETLAAVGQYGVNVSAFVADGYGTKKTAIEDDTVIHADADAYKVVVVTSTKTDRDTATDDVDVYAFDNVDVEVRVYGPRFVAADVTLTYDDDNFEINNDYDTPTGWSERDNTFRYYNAKPKNSENNYYVPDQIDENGNAYYSLGKWVFTVLDRDASEFDTDEAGEPIMHVPFEVKAEEGEGDYIRDTYVSGAWKDGWSNDSANKLSPETQLTNDYANIRLIDMAVTVNKAEGLVFKNADQALFVATKPYEAKTASGATVKTTTTLETCVLTSEEVANGIVPTDDDYFEGLPEALNADTYTVYYKVSAPGYVTVTGSTTVTIKPKDIDVKWMVDSEIGEDFTIAYSESEGKAYDAPNASFNDVDGHDIDKDGYHGVVEGYYLNANFTGTKYDTMEAAKDAVTVYKNTEGESADNKWYLEEDYSGTPYDTEELAKAATVYTKYDKTIYTEIKLIQVDEFAITGAAQTSTALQKVGEYTYQVNIVENGRYSSNYNIRTGDTQKVTIEGGRFSGYTLTNASEGESVYYDQQSHVPAKLSFDLDDEGTHPGQGEPAPDVTYSWMKAGDPAGWHEGLSTIPSFTDMGTYILKANLTADSYYNYETEPVYFTVKPVDYKAETFEWVAGWSVVLVYTNEDIPGFTYDGTMMFNMDGLGYKFGADLAADGSRGDESFNHVFGIVVFGAANTTLVCSSNDTAKSINNIDSDGEYDSRYDVNHNDGVLIDDYVAVQGTYNVEKTYFDAVNQVVISDSIMQTVLKADVNGDKIVDTYDVALIKANSDNN